MHITNRSRINGVGLAAMALGLIYSTTASAQTGTSVAGVINSNDVYVRSGDSLNHYTICKLNTGDKVTVIGERGEWYEILPTPGTFSLISGDYVDRSDSRGVVNGNNVRVRAGSLLNDNKYTVQAMLNKGAEVRILGSNPDGFLRIEPPVGAALWVARQFVSLDGAAIAPAPVVPVTDSTAASAPQETYPRSETQVPMTPDAPVQVTQKPPVERVSVATSTTPASASIPADSPLAGVTTTDHARRLHTLETSLQVELTKPLYERNFTSLVTGYQGIADQTEDDVARRYAMGRLTQLTELRDLTDRAAKLRGLDEETSRQREQFLQQRVSIPVPPPPDPAALDVQGELRESALYPAGALPKRYRLVDPNGDRVRTIAYVEVPSESGIRAEEYVGRFVGVRASGQRPHEGGIDPVPVYIAREIVAVGQTAGISAVSAPSTYGAPLTPATSSAPATSIAPSSYIEPSSAVVPRTFDAGVHYPPTASPQVPASYQVPASPDSTSHVIMRDVK